MTSRRFQFRLVAWFWLVLVVAAFFLGRNWDRFERGSASPAASPGGYMFGVGSNSDAGISAAIIIDETSFAVIAEQADTE